MSVSGNGVSAVPGGMSEEFVRLMLRMSTDKEFADHLQKILDATEAHKHALNQLDLGMQAKDALERAAGLEKAAKLRLDEINAGLNEMKERATVEAKRMLADAETRFQDKLADAKAKADALLSAAEAKMAEAEEEHDTVREIIEAAAATAAKAEERMKAAEEKLAEALAEKEKNLIESRRLATLAEKLNKLFNGDGDEE